MEVTWKSKIKAQFPNPNDYSAFMGDFSTATGAVTFTMMILSRWIFQRFGWGMAALITPTVLLLTGGWAGGRAGGRAGRGGSVCHGAVTSFACPTLAPARLAPAHPAPPRPTPRPRLQASSSSPWCCSARRWSRAWR